MKSNTLVMEHLERAVQAAVGPMVIQALLPGVEVRFTRFNRGASGDMFSAFILVSREYALESLPKRGNRPMVDQDGSNRWWYDLTASVGTRDYQYPTNKRARAALNREVASILAKIAQIHLERQLAEMVAAL